MKVRELIEMLEDEDPEREVYFSYNYGDYGRTLVAQPVKEVEPAGEVEYSEYFRMHKLSDPDRPADKAKRVVVLS